MKKLIYLLIYFVILITVNAIVMPNYDYWLSHVQMHISLATSLLFIDLISISVVLPREIAKIYFKLKK